MWESINSGGKIKALIQEGRSNVPSKMHLISQFPAKAKNDPRTEARKQFDLCVDISRGVKPCNCKCLPRTRLRESGLLWNIYSLLLESMETQKENRSKFGEEFYLDQRIGTRRFFGWKLDPESPFPVWSPFPVCNSGSQH